MLLTQRVALMKFVFNQLGILEMLREAVGGVLGQIVPLLRSSTHQTLLPPPTLATFQVSRGPQLARLRVKRRKRSFQYCESCYRVVTRMHSLVQPP